MAARRTRSVGIDIIPGRIRLAREAARLSLAQVTRRDISRTALHLMETGKCRPTLTTLKMIAERTGQPLEYFLTQKQADALHSDGPLIQELELAVAQGRYDDARQMTTRLLNVTSDQVLRCRICLLGAQASLQLASVEAAIPLLVEARAVAESGGNKGMLAECLDWQAAAEHLLELPSALSLAQQALAVANALEPTPDRLLVRIHGRIGSICVAQHKWREAIDAYQRAADVGRGVLDISRRAKMYNDLSIAYRRLGDLATATEFAQKAVSIHELLNDGLSVGRAETNLALALIRQGHPNEAGRNLDHALTLFVAADQKRGRSHILLAQAELLMTTGDPAGAREKALAAVDLAEELNEKVTVSEAKQILATVAEVRDDPNESDRLFAESIELLKDLKLGTRLTAVHAAYAATLEQRGETGRALAEWRLAVATTHPEAVMPLAVKSSERDVVRGSRQSA